MGSCPADSWEFSSRKLPGCRYRGGQPECMTLFSFSLNDHTEELHWSGCFFFIIIISSKAWDRMCFFMIYKHITYSIKSYWIETDTSSYKARDALSTLSAPSFIVCVYEQQKQHCYQITEPFTCRWITAIKVLQWLMTVHLFLTKERRIPSLQSVIDCFVLTLSPFCAWFFQSAVNSSPFSSESTSPCTYWAWEPL